MVLSILSKSRLPAFAVLVCMCLAFAGVADFGPQKTVVIVNSNSFEDAVSGSVYCAKHNCMFSFILTESHGKYWEGLIEKSSDNILYFESSSPVYSGMRDRLSGLSRPNIFVSQSQNPAQEFLSLSPSNKAVIVGRQIGAEAISIAPYAARADYELHFAGEEDADSKASSLLLEGKQVLVYGSIANSISSQDQSGLNVINSGSIYLDNLHILNLYFSQFAPSQALFASGKAFESHMTGQNYPIALVGRTEPTQGLLELISSSKIRSGLVFLGDADISGALASIKMETGLPIFAKLGQGFSGDAQMQALAVMPVPSKNVFLTVSSVGYSPEARSFNVQVTNSGDVTAFVSVGASTPKGTAGSSQRIEIPSGKTIAIPVRVSGVSTSGNYVPQASFQIYSGSDPHVVESIDTINFTNIKLSASIPSYSKNERGGNGESARIQDNYIFISLIVVVLVIAGGYLFIHAWHGPNAHFKRSGTIVRGKKKRR